MLSEKFRRPFSQQPHGNVRKKHELLQKAEKADIRKFNFIKGVGDWNRF